MNAAELYKAGRLGEAVEAQLLEVKANPLDQARRLFLFELAMFTGDLDRARRQIDALEYTDNDLQRAAMGYRKLIDSEQARRDVFGRGVAPGFFGEPAEHLRLRLEAVQRLREGAALRLLSSWPAPQKRLHRFMASSTGNRSRPYATPTTCSAASSRSWPRVATSGLASSSSGWWR